MCEEDAEDAAQGEDEDEVDGDEDQVMGQAGAAAASEEGAAVHGVPKGAELVCGLGGQRPSHVLARVYSAGDHWCFVQFDNDDDEDNGGADTINGDEGDMQTAARTP